jgi:hypothetical protein
MRVGIMSLDLSPSKSPPPPTTTFPSRIYQTNYMKRQLLRWSLSTRRMGTYRVTGTHK